MIKVLTYLGVRYSQKLTNVGIGVVKHANVRSHLRRDGQIGPIGQRPGCLPCEICIVWLVDLSRDLYCQATEKAYSESCHGHGFVFSLGRPDESEIRYGWRRYMMIRHFMYFKGLNQSVIT